MIGKEMRNLCVKYFPHKFSKKKFVLKQKKCMKDYTTMAVAKMHKYTLHEF